MDQASINRTENGYEVRDSNTSYGTFGNIVQAQVRQVQVNSEKEIKASSEQERRKAFNRATAGRKG